MARLMLISATTANSSQVIGDIVRHLEDDEVISEHELALFDIQECTNVVKQEIMDQFDSLIDEDAEYPKFAFSTVTLTAQQKADLADVDVNHDDTMAIIETIPIKDPV